MRFWWPDWEPRERSPSTDSECSTASHSSFASDASFYSASSGEAVRDVAVDPPADPLEGPPAGPLGLGLHSFAPVLSPLTGEIGPTEPPRAVPLLGTGAASAAETAASSPRPSGPSAPPAATRPDASSAQARLRRTASEAAAPARAGAALEGARPLPDPQARRSAREDPPPASPPLAAALSPSCGRISPGRAGGTLPDWTAPGATLEVATAAALAVCHEPSGDTGDDSSDDDGQDHDAAAPVPRQDPSRELARPGRAAGRLPDQAVPAPALAAATARATATPSASDSGSSSSSDADAGAAAPEDPANDGYPPGRAAGMLPAGGVAIKPADRASAAGADANQHRHVPGDDGTATQGKTTATTPATDPANVLPIPGRAGGMLTDAVATAATHRVAAVAAAQALPTVGRAAVEHRARAEPPQDQETSARACVELQVGDVSSIWRSFSSSRLQEDDGDDMHQDHEDRVVAAVPMDVDEDAQWPTPGQRPLSPPPELRVGGKRRRLNDSDDDDEDIRELVELLLAEEEVGTQDPAPRLSAASAHPASVLTVYAHNTQRFNCTLCVYSAASFAALTRHRDSRHRRTTFLDRFSADCACGVPFASRLAAARHSQTCASLTHPPSAATAPAAGELNPTADAVNATVPAVTAALDPPRQDTPELAVPPPLTSSLPVAAQIPVQQDRGRWDPPLPRELVAERVATRLGEVLAPRWGPPLPRSMVASRIANRLLPPAVTRDEETKETKEDEETKDDRGPDHGDGDQDGEWLLRFDGACRANPGPGGAGAALFKPNGPVVWTCSCYMPSSSETNNTAEYTALLLGVRAAADHGVKCLRVEGDSTLVIQQVRGIFATRSTRLRELRRHVKRELARVGSFSLHHIDRQANAHADRLANAALDRRRTKLECGVHVDGTGCTRTTTDAPTLAAPAPPVARPPPRTPTDPDDQDDDLADIDDGEVYAAMRVGPDAVPQRRPRLRLRQLPDEEAEVVGAMVERFGASLAAKITDASDWETAEGYITALPHLLYDKLQPYSQVAKHPPQPRTGQPQSRPSHAPRDPLPDQRQQPANPQRHPRTTTTSRHRQQRRSRRRRRRRPPRVTRHHREHRLDEALDELHAVQRHSPGNRSAVAKARRRVGRINSAVAQQQLRHQFDTSEKECVDGILAAARAKRTSTGPAATAPPPSEPANAGTCPIPAERLHEFFTAVNTPTHTFEAMAGTGERFRQALERLPAARERMELLREAPTVDDIEDQLLRVRGNSSPGLDGVGYDVYKPSRHSYCRSCTQLSRAVGDINEYRKAGSSEWSACCSRREIGTTLPTGARSAYSKQSTSSTLA
ncbi:Ribonuclease HI [Phytophthora citrophthora]|uniref:Ribonuclease HI n=1 Tax=Phytophthora citrophthora TaxID=4793 RepID=A0AAD9L9L8_9STRA|nr:Ribonuclease HI [Phytophthora citrophthora]